MRWIRIIAGGLAAALVASVLSVGLVTADDCNQPAPDDFRSDVAWDGTGLHHQPQDVQDLFSSVWGTDDDLHVRTWAWQHDCRTQPRDAAANPTDGSSTTNDADSNGSSSDSSGGGGTGLQDSGGANAAVATGGGCREPKPALSGYASVVENAWYYCDEGTGQWVRGRRLIPSIDYAADDQLVAPSVGNCGPGLTHYDPIREICLLFPDGPDV